MMAFCGTFSPAAYPGETQPYSLDLSLQLTNGDSIASTSAALTLKLGTDATPSAWLIGSATYLGNIVSQNVGGALPGGLQAGALYTITFTTLTANGKTLVHSADIPISTVL